MPKYLADRPDQIVDTAIRCLTNLSHDDVFTESGLIALGESAKKSSYDESLSHKIANVLNKTADAIENHGKVAKDNAKSSTKKVNSWKGLSDKKVEVRDTKKTKTLARNAQKELERAKAEGADKSVIDKIMDAYKEHRKAVLATAAVSVIAIPALISGIINGFNDAIDSTTAHTRKFVKDLADDLENGSENGMDPKTASAYGAAYSSISRDIIADDVAQYSGAINAINQARERGES